MEWDAGTFDGALEEDCSKLGTAQVLRRVGATGVVKRSLATPVPPTAGCDWTCREETDPLRLGPSRGNLTVRKTTFKRPKGSVLLQAYLKLQLHGGDWKDGGRVLGLVAGLALTTAVARRDQHVDPGEIREPHRWIGLSVRGEFVR